MLTDEEIARLTPDQRANLLYRLGQPIADADRVRRRMLLGFRVRMAMMAVGALLLAPWTAYLAADLPETYRAHHWNVVWAGFDAMMLVLVVATLALALGRRVLAIPVAFATGVLVACDAWFDVVTADAGDRTGSIAMALLVELPAAIVLIGGALRVLRLAATRMWLIAPGQHVWQARIPARAPQPPQPTASTASTSATSRGRGLRARSRPSGNVPKSSVR